ncbi:MAG: MFS transporter [Bacteroidales bacterium]|nr:MFS transporter [Bacteroidales bacterium]
MTFLSSAGPLTDALATQFAQYDKKHSYGSFRLWGSLGWALASVLGGIAFTYIDIKYIFSVSALLMLLTIVFLSTRKRKRVFTADFKKVSLKSIVNDKKLMIFTGIMVFYGIACSPVNSYLNLYFRELGAGNNIIGFAYAIMAFSELPLFILGNRLLTRWGAQRIILIAMITMVLRLLVYGLFPIPQLALVVGAFQGISLAFFW